MLLGLWPYVAAVTDFDAQTTICADCIVKTYDGPTLDAIVDGPTELVPDNLYVILGDSESLLDLNALHTFGRYGDEAPSRTCDACGEPFVDVSTPDELPF